MFSFKLYNFNGKKVLQVLKVKKSGSNIDQFSNLDLTIGDIFITCIFRLKNYHLQHVSGRRHPTEQHEILDGIGAKPGGGHITRRCDHRRVLDISRQVFHAAPWGAFDPKTCFNDNF